jgi:hypothetical protein
MIIMRFDEYSIPIDALRLIVNRSEHLPVIILINGHGQMGKSTFLFHLANRIMQIKKYGNEWRKHKNEWNLWNWQRNCTRTPQQFVEVLDKSEGEILALEEASHQMPIYEWWGVMGTIFSDASNTQGVRFNISILITPQANDLQKQHKRKFDFVLWVAKKWKETKCARVVPRWVKINYLTLKEDNCQLRYIHNWDIHYTDLELLLSSNYTNWLENYKRGSIMDDMKAKVGIYNPNKPISKKNMPYTLKMVAEKCGIEI